MPTQPGEVKPGSGFAVPLLLAHAVDRISDAFAILAAVAVIASCVISAGNAFSRYLFNASSNGWLEIQWYLFAACVMLGAAQVLRLNEHVRVDVLYGGLSSRNQVRIDLFGLIVFLLPVMSMMVWMSWPLFIAAWRSGEASSNAGGLVRWPVLLMLPVGFGLLWLQGLAELVKRLAWMGGAYEFDTQYERPQQ